MATLSRPISFIACTFSILSLPAMALPKSGIYPWVDHAQQFWNGAEVEPQHYASAIITRVGTTGRYSFYYRCENGTASTSNDGLYKAQLLDKDGNVLFEYAHSCHLERGETHGSNATGDTPKEEFDLTNIIDRVTAVRVSADPLSSLPHAEPPRRPPGVNPPPAPCGYGNPC